MPALTTNRSLLAFWLIVVFNIPRIFRNVKHYYRISADCLPKQPTGYMESTCRKMWSLPNYATAQKQPKNTQEITGFCEQTVKSQEKIKEISTKMQQKQEKREEIEPYKEKNVQNLKNGEKHGENEEVAE